MSLLGLDVGTTGCKGVVFNESGEILTSSYREYFLHHPQPGWIELDPLEVWRSVENVLKEVNAKAQKDPVEALGISSLGEASVPLSSTGEILGQSIICFDSRGEETVAKLGENISPLEFMGITGQPLSRILGLNKILWWKHNEPKIFRQVRKFLCFEDFIIYKLGLTPTIDYSLASRMGCFDMGTKKWSKKILDIGGLEENLLSEVKPSGTVVGEIPKKLAESLNFRKRVKVVTGGHDQPAGALGAGILKRNQAVDATGTVECITAVTDRPVVNEKMLDSNLPCYPCLLPGKFVTLAFNLTGGSLLKWYRDQFANLEVEKAKKMKKDPYKLILGNLPNKPTSLLVLPHFTMTGTPYMDSDSQGAIIGLSLATTKEEIVKSLLEGITLEIKLNLECLKSAGIEVEEIRAVGGGAKSSLWLQLKADIFNLPVATLNVSEGVCLGVALLAGKAVGKYATLEEATEKAIKIVKTFHPAKEKVAIYEDKFLRYKKLYTAVKGIYHS